MRKILIPLAVTCFLIILLFLLFGNVESFFEDLLNRSQNNPSKYAILSFIILVSDIALPVPSSIVMYLNGTILGFAGGFVLSFVSVILSSVAGYFIGRGSSAVLKSEADISANKIMEKYGYPAILMTRGIPIISESICIVCGFNRFNFSTYLIMNIVGYVPICLVYAYFGSVALNKNLFLISFGGSLLITFVLWFFGRRIFKDLQNPDSG
ncbi:MAG: VTT domain-containing protein [Pyrinomonadaceae bacterium]|nr:VTT domain-containing protein [Pyrinomonadaceae bacterium]